MAQHSKTFQDGVIPDYVKEEVLHVVRKEFPPEFINRIDDMVIFNNLSQQDLRQIVDLRLSEVQTRLNERRMTLNVNEEAKEWLSEHGYDPVYGARPLNRLIQHDLLNPLAKLLIDGTVCNGDSVSVVVESGSIKLHK